MQEILVDSLISAFVPLLKNPYIWAMLAAGVLVRIMKTAWFKGKFGEWVVARALARRLEPTAYQVLNNVMIPDQAGGTTQIDHIVFSPFGVFVIETKNMKGWIFGNANAASWNQTIFRSKHSFQNPFRQNYKHVKCLAELTGLDERHLIHVIVFIGDCTIKTRETLPESLVTNGRELAAFIKKHQEPVIPIEALQAAIQRLSTGQLKNSFANQRAHVSHVREIAEGKQRPAPMAAPVAPAPPLSNASPAPQDTATASPTCPRCGSAMVLRTASKGANAGNRFWGCSNYPNCRGIESMGDL